MKPSLFCLCLGIAIIGFSQHAAGENRKFFLWQSDHDRGVGTNVWWLPENRCKLLPVWNLETEPPLSPKKAIEIARKWIGNMGGGGDIDSILLRPVHDSDHGPYRHTFFFIFDFAVAPYGNHLTCVVLMDGTVLEPEKPGGSTSKNSSQK